MKIFFNACLVASLVAAAHADAGREVGGGEPPAAPQQQYLVAQSGARGLDFNAYIRLRVGMSEGELLSYAGAPDRDAVENIEKDIVKTYYYMSTPENPFITTIKLRGGKIESIDRTKKF